MTVSSLSAVPLSWRPQLTSNLIGRKRDLDWLRSTSGDRIVSGQPGAGKTELLRRFVNDDRALFLVSVNRSEVRAALLELVVSQGSDLAVIVDDAHHYSQGLQVLLHLRQELNATFPVIATCWPGSVEDLQKTLGLGQTAVRCLELLTRDEILEVYAAAGVTKEWARGRFSSPPEEILRSLVDLACNKPGLAVTFASLFLQGDFEEIFTGRGLLREMGALEKLLGKGALTTLAGFAVGGRAGMPIAAVASFVETSVAKIREMAVGLEAGGALSENPDKVLYVEPRQLRSALLADFFFQGKAADLEVEALLGAASSVESAIEAILWSSEAGAVIDPGWIRSLLSEHGSLDLWRLYTSLGCDEAHWALEQFPGEPIRLAEQALLTAPEAMIPCLLKAAEEEDAAPGRGAGNSMGALRSWVGELNSRLDPLERRRLLATFAMEALRKEESVGAALEALFIALSPILSRSSQDAGFGSKVTIYSSHLTLDDIEGLIDLWNEAAEYLPEILPEWLSKLHPTLWQWIHPGDGGRFELDEEIRNEMLQHARQMLLDLSDCAEGSVAVRADLERLSRDLEEPLGLDLDEEYEILFPDRPRGEIESEPWKAAKSREEEAIRNLACRWRERDPASVAERLSSYSEQARKAGHTRSRIGAFAGALSERVEGAVAWAAALAKQGLSESLIEPFLENAAKNGEKGWTSIAESLLGDGDSSGETFLMVMTCKDSPSTLRDLALEKASSFLFRFQDLRQEAPVETMQRLLGHEVPYVAAMAAVAEWLGSEEKPPSSRARLEQEWRDAILGFAPDVEDNRGDLYWMKEILAGDRELAFCWLKHRIEESLPGVLRHDRLYRAAIRSLERDQRLRLFSLLESVVETPGSFRLVIDAVGSDPDLYQGLLMHAVLRPHHLRPLAVETSYALNDAWAERAALAVGAGFSPEDIVRSTIYGGGAIHISGTGVSFWQAWRDAFLRFEKDPRPEIQKVVARGISKAEESLGAARKKKRQRELKGI